MAEIGRETDKLTASQQRAIFALLTAPNIRDAAKQAKVSETTLFRWLRDEAFNKTYLEARRQAASQAIAQLQQCGSEAVETLREIMKDRQASASARVSAAKTALELSAKALELEDLALRVEELEKHIERQKRK